MRIIAGKYKSRKLKLVPSNDTRETSDKVRGAVFNSLSDKVMDSCVLDLFAGSGAYGLEAISRGAKNVLFNDVKQNAIKTIKENISSLNLIEQSEVLKLDYKKVLQRLENSNYKFDLVFIDPPYILDIYEDISNELYPYLNSDAILILEMDKQRSINKDVLHRFEVSKEKLYGSKKILYLTKL